MPLEGSAFYANIMALYHGIAGLNKIQILSKKPFILRIDKHTQKLLEKWAADEFRSLNGQIEYLLHRALVLSHRWKEEEIPLKRKSQPTTIQIVINCPWRKSSSAGGIPGLLYSQGWRRGC